MKKRIYAILAVLIMSALAMMGCSDGGDPDAGTTTYTVTFDKNGGTDEADPKTASTKTSGGFVTLPPTNPPPPPTNSLADGTLKRTERGRRLPRKPR
jgi:hypothetical protein